MERSLANRAPIRRGNLGRSVASLFISSSVFVPLESSHNYSPLESLEPIVITAKNLLPIEIGNYIKTNLTAEIILDNGNRPSDFPS
jgi:hypothetical protein